MKTIGAKRIAERYVKALFDLAQPAHAVDQVEADLLALAAAVRQSPEFARFLSNPLLSRDMQAAAMDAMLKQLKAHEVTRKFVAALARHKRLPLLADAAELFSRIAQASRGEMSAEVVAAAALGKTELSAVSDRLGKAYGKKINLAVSEDANLLGGIVIKIGSVQLDGSLAGKLDRLGQKLKAA